MRRTPEGLLLIGRRELGKRIGQAAGVGLVATTGVKLFESSANAAIATPDNPLAFMKYVKWESLAMDTIEAAAAKEGLALRGIPYRDLDHVREIHGPGNWEFVPGEGRFAARLSDPNGNDVVAKIDGNTVGQGYKLLSEPDLPQGFREERFVVGPGVDGRDNTFRGKGILVRRDVFPDNHYTLVLTLSTNNTNDENNRNGTGIDGITVIGIGGFRGAGDLRAGFKRGIPFANPKEVADIYGGSPSDYDWLRDKDGKLLEGQYAVVFRSEPRGHRHLILAADTSYRTVIEGNRFLWSPTSIAEERVVVGPAQYGIYIKQPIIRRYEDPDAGYKFELGTKSANTIVENFRNGTNIQVIGVNGFRGGQ